MSAAEPDTAGTRSRRLRAPSRTPPTPPAAPASGSATNSSPRSASVRPGPGATRYQSSSGTRLRSGSKVPSMTHRSGTAWARWKSLGSISTIFCGGRSETGTGAGAAGSGGGSGAFLHAASAPSASATAAQRRIGRTAKGLPAACARPVGGELAEEVDDPRLEHPGRGALVGEIRRFEPDPTAALAGLVDEGIPLVLTLDGEQPHVVDRASARIGVRICPPSHAVQRLKPGMDQHAVQIRRVEPQATALLAVEEDPFLSLGELGHLDVIARA